MVVTGASSGIGAAIARRAAQEGYAVVVNFPAYAAGASLVVRHITGSGGTAVAVQADVSDPAAVEALVDAADQLGKFAAGVNKAGITGNLIGKLADVPAETVRRVMDVNVSGPIYVCQAAVRGLGRNTGGNGGSIINISSTATKAGSPGTWAHYAASKGAVDVLTVGLVAGPQ
ncbi:MULTISPECIES: SDR family NAD(P)-dependent oxidoreductase [unclassified Arthrobacter]|uniref:SDR family NAD(P)-dependent oxidoreductase n=1 Tax=unclassified Arthrobacter TaxID=235627 RepID=UPI0033968A3E